MSDINIRIDAAEAELDRLIEELDEAMLKRDNLLASEAQITAIRLQLMDAENELLQLYDKEKFEALLAPENIDATMAKWVEEFEAAQAQARMVEQQVDEVLLKAGGLDGILFKTEVTDAAVMSLRDRFIGMDLPQIDRATRVIAMRVPVLREAIQIISVLRRTQWALQLDDAKRKADLIEGQVDDVAAKAAGLGLDRGSITAAITLTLALWGVVQKILENQRRLEAQQKAIMRQMSQRDISMEEAIRGYDQLPERYRSTVPP